DPPVDRGEPLRRVKPRRGFDDAAVEREQPPALLRDDAVAGVGHAGIDAEDDHVHGWDSASGLGRLPRRTSALSSRREHFVAITRARLLRATKLPYSEH